MNITEIKQAVALLSDRIDRHETIIDGDGQSLTVWWLDGSGQRMFLTLEEVYEDAFNTLCGKRGTHMELASELEELGFDVNMDTETSEDGSLSRIVLPATDRVIGTITGDSNAVIE